MADITDKISNYLEFQKGMYGDELPYDRNVIKEVLAQFAKEKEAFSTTKKFDSGAKSIKSELQSPISNVSADAKYNTQQAGAVTPSTPIKPEIPEYLLAISSLDELHDKICNCMACPLGKTRRNFVFGTGNPNADILIIGEGPGAEEDAQGKPFVGRSGQLLTKIIEAIKFTRDEVFIANIVKCRPPENRRPEVNEIDACEPYLKRQIDLIKPQFILALGLTAVDTLFKKKHKMGDIRGKLQNYHGIPTLATYHPAALLRNPNLKRDTWEDVKFLRRLYDEKNANQ